MSKEDNGTEYVYLGPKGEEAYEIVFASHEAFKFAALHGLTRFMPLKAWEELAYNCVEGKHEPDWTAYNAFEVHAMDKDDNNLDGIDEAADHWCVFGHCKEGLDDITNTKTHSAAMQLARHFAYRAKLEKINPWTALEDEL